MTTTTPQRLASATALSLLAVLAWDAGGGDLALARWFGDARGFALREQWFFSTVLHDAVHWISVMLLLWLCLSVPWPLRGWRRVVAAQRAQFAFSVALAALLIAGLKSASDVNCPWDLALFGGDAPYVPHWHASVQSGSGHCFPAGHAVSGFGFIGGYFALRPHAARSARAWLWGALAAGFGLGLAQQARGAHFMSHTLWSAWLCWASAWCVDLVGALTWQRRQTSACLAP